MMNYEKTQLLKESIRILDNVNVYIYNMQVNKEK